MKEVWKDISGYNKYQASTLGRIRSIDRVVYKRSIKNKLKGKILSPGDSGHYHFVYLYKKSKSKRFYVHRLVMATFFKKSKMQINHINGKGYDNRFKNLEYVTPKENMSHAINTGLRKRKLTKLDVETIRFFYCKPMGPKSTTHLIAKIFGVEKQMIKRIIRGETYNDY